jgi:hypothetical protein
MKLQPVTEQGEDKPYGYMLECSGCKSHHVIYVRQTRYGKSGPVWQFNNDLEKPTFNPSLLVRWEEGENFEKRVCHSFIRDGRIEFLSDCTHELAGKTVELPDMDEER